MQPTAIENCETSIVDVDHTVLYGSVDSDDIFISNNNDLDHFLRNDETDDSTVDAYDDDDDEDEDAASSDVIDPENNGSLLVNDTNNNNINGGANGGGGHFFEGAEKRLAIYFKHSIREQQKDPALDLRKITRAQWTQILDLVHCKILNVITNENYHAYLLSESSLFVAKKFFILKTCGNTTLLDSMDMILDVVFNFVGFDTIEDVYYSHKNLLLPRLQKKPHNSFVSESQHLDKVFEGMAHVFGHINADRWYLYTEHNDDHFVNNHHHHHHNNHHQLQFVRPQQKLGSLNKNEHFKFEMIMEELDQTVMQWFFTSPLKLTATQVTHQSGIDSIIPGMVIDDFLFQPCGYSMNGLLGQYYMTIHITPETEFSYVSLETNMPQKSYPQFIEKVLDIFKPGKFMLNLFVPNFNYQKTIQQQLNELIECKSGGSDGGSDGDGDDENFIITDNNGSLVDGLGNNEDVDDDENDENDRNNNNNNNNSSSNNNGGNKCSSLATSLDSFGKIHGLMLYETFSSNGITIGYNHFANNHYRRCDFQMVQSEHLDIIYARYVNEGIS